MSKRPGVPVSTASPSSAAEYSRLVDAWEQTIRSLLAFGEQLTDEDWARPTDCPGWPVKDHFAHVVGVERALLGDPPDDHVAPAAPWVRNDVGRLMEDAVDWRRRVPGPAVLAELQDVAHRRLAALRADSPAPDALVPGPLGSPLPAAELLALRTYDVWAHEQDVRRATGRRGNLSGPAAEVSRDRILRALPRVVAKDAGAPPGSSVVFAVRGEVAFVRTVVVGADGRGRLVDAQAQEGTGQEADSTPEPTVRLGLEWQTFTSLAAGRCAPDCVEVHVSGDIVLASRILEAMAITP